MPTSARRVGPTPLHPAPWPPANSFRDLLDVAADAVDIRPPLYLKSLFGPASSWTPPRRRYSEFTIIDPHRAVRSLRYLRDASVPARPWSAPGWARALMPAPVRRLFWRPSRFFEQRCARPCPCTDERWFFINGVATNEDVARLNSAFLAHLFHRPFTVMQNATNSLLVDLIEAAVGKGFKTDPDSEDRRTMTEPAWKATAAILEALNAATTKRVVVIAHSQGTIIIANVLRAIARTLGALGRSPAAGGKLDWGEYTAALMGGVESESDRALCDELTRSLSGFGAGRTSTVLGRLQKLEIYTFANCADQMKHVARRNGRPIPYLEHFANEFDVVARLGILSPNSKIDIDGPAYLSGGTWGHLLNEHHLFAIEDYLAPRAGTARDENPYAPRDPMQADEPRLYGYAHGRRPGGY